MSEFIREDQIVVGVCAMDKKTRSKQMQNILSRLQAYGEFETIIFGSDCILNKPVEEWPKCDCLISFHSGGFPLEKSVDYVKLRNPICVNDVYSQDVMLDRKQVYETLERDDIPTARHFYYNHTDPGENTLVEHDNYLIINGERLDKPFVEKPISGEDHNIYIYYPKSEGGGSRRLFRKVNDRSSRAYPDISNIRTDAYYIYEELVPGGVDVKVYTIFSHCAHAEKRKSPTVDGIVQRDINGKEIRVTARLPNHEREIARKVCIAFKQNICGFDLLRSGGKSYVIDVNGWSFVKGNVLYHDDCARLLRMYCLKMMNRLTKPRFSVTPAKRSPRESPEAVYKTAPIPGTSKLNSESPPLRPDISIPLLASQTLVNHKQLSAAIKFDGLVMKNTPILSEVAKQSISVPLPIQNINGMHNLSADYVAIMSSSSSPKVMDRGVIISPTASASPSPHADGVGEITSCGYERAIADFDKRHILLGMVAVFRHGDRTPKQKLKFHTSHPTMLKMFSEKKKEIKLKKSAQVRDLLDVIKGICEEQKDSWKLDELRKDLRVKEHEISIAYKSKQYEDTPTLQAKINEIRSELHTLRYETMKLKDPECYKNHKNFRKLRNILEIGYPGTKFQLKPQKFRSNQVVSALAIIKWGGAITDAGLRQCEQYGPVFRDEMLRGTPDERKGFLQGLQLWTSDEKRVKQTAKKFVKSFLFNEKIPQKDIHQGKHTQILLDDISKAAPFINKAKSHIYKTVTQNTADISLLGDDERKEYGHEPWTQHSLRRLLKPLDKLQSVYNFIDELLSRITTELETIGDRLLYMDEPLRGMKQRWMKLYQELFDEETKAWNTTKLPDVYDCLKYDVLHNSEFLKGIEQLYYDAKLISDFIIPCEYGVSRDQKLTIGTLIVGPLLQRVLSNLESARSAHAESRVSLYFTSESYLQAFRNVLTLCGTASNHIVSESVDSMELNYFTHAVIRLFEDPARSLEDPMRLYVSIMFSPGAASNPFACTDEYHTLPVHVPLPLNGRLSYKTFYKSITDAISKTNLVQQAAESDAESSPDFSVDHNS